MPVTLVFPSALKPEMPSPGETVGNPLSALGTMLMERGTIDLRTLDRARRVSEETGARLDRVLTQLGLVSDRGLAETFAALTGARLIGPGDFPDTPLFADRLRPKFLRKAQAMPISGDSASVILAMADPLDRFTPRAVEKAIGRRVEIAVAVPIDLEAAFDRLYVEPEDGAAPAEPLETASQEGTNEPLEEDT